MFPKLHKSKEINDIIEIKRTEYIQIDKDVLIEVDQLRLVLFFPQVEYPKFYIVLWICFIFNPTHC